RLRNVLLSAVDRATADQWDPVIVRDDVARRFLVGEGIEIGALSVPLHLPPGAHVRYVDRKSNAALAEDFPELDPTRFVPVDVVDDGASLRSFADATLDFVVANHVTEHTEDPIAALQSQVRVLRDGGVLFLVVPDRRFTFDRDRPATTLEHLQRDHEQGPQWSRREHYREWVSLVERFDPQDVEARAAKLDAEQASIHFHTWQLEDFLALLGYCQDELELAARLEHAQMIRAEFLVVLRKHARRG
ncbi:MAG: methyltransferase domain-containing protein, partial [Solirubrobacteraceae bacterium]